MDCQICKTSCSTKINTYKYEWCVCPQCGTYYRDGQKLNLPADQLLKVKVFRKILDKLALTPRLQFSINKTNSDFYKYYKQTARKGLEGSKWEHLVGLFKEELSRNHDLSHLRVLDISGGPGFLTQVLSPMTHKTLLTEFNEEAVKGMVEALGIEAIKYDYNSDMLENIVTEKYDIILVVFSLNFCNDIDAFFKSLSNITTKNSAVYLYHSPPTGGLTLRWQFTDYIYLRAWSEKAVIRAMKKNGFTLIKSQITDSYPFWKGWGSNLKKKISSMFLLLISAKFYIQNSKENNFSNFNQSNLLQVFKREE